MELTKDQQIIFNVVETTNTHLLISGKPGTGKSVLTRALLHKGQKNYVIAAPTGLAALNANGKTLHSIFRIPISDGILEPDFNGFNMDDRTVNYIKYRVNVLVIDEISMVRADTLDFIDRMLRYIKENDKPFGGIQVIFVGDFFQLPPVVNKFHKKALLEAGYSSEFAFSSKVWEESEIGFAELTEVLRQKGDLEFMGILNSARDGVLSTKQMSRLNKQVAKLDEFRIALTGVNKDADYINQRKLKELDTEPHQFTGKQYGEWPAFPVEPNLTLKVGAQVMVKVNGADRTPGSIGEFASKVVNGTIGIVEEVCKPEQGDAYVSIKLESGESATIYTKRWERKIREKNSAGEWEERVVAGYSQMPLSLAWAISMHKSQGQSFDKVHIDARKIFAAGQLYVALSRCRTLEGVSLESPITKEKFWANQKVVRFYEDQFNLLNS